MKATIAAGGAPLTTFVQTWTVASREAQRELLSVMRRSVGALRGAPGFVSLALHPSDDGHRVAVYGQWRSAADMAAAVATPAAKAGHDEFLRWGSPDGGAVYAVADVFGPSAAPESGDSSALRSRAQERWAAQGFETRMVQVNGSALHVAERGEGDPILLLHGYPQSGEIWRRVAPELARSHRVIVPDLPGMGLSDPGRGYDLGTVAEDLHQLAAALDLKAVKIAGHDWGASAAAVYALRYRAAVTKLAFIEGVLPGAGFEAQWTFAERNDLFTFIPFLLMGQGDADGDITAALLEGHEATYLHHLWAHFTGDKDAAPFEAWAPYVAAMARPRLAASSASYYRAAYETAAQVKALLATKLEIPVLPIAGGRGIGKNLEAFAAAFAVRASTPVIVEGAGHFVVEERPKELASLLREFFA